MIAVNARRRYDAPAAFTGRFEMRVSRVQHTLESSLLQDIVHRVVGVARPERIILFGSAARGTMGPNSDIDLLVIKRGRFNRGRLIDRIYLGLRGAKAAVDVLVVTPEEVEQYRNSHCLVIAPALAEGRVVYAA